MVVNFIIHAVLSILQTILGVLPTVPAVPSAVVSGGDWVVSTIASVISVLRMVYGGPLLDAIVIVIVALFNFEWIYHTVLWIVRKIPMINIK